MHNMLEVVKSKRILRIADKHLIDKLKLATCSLTPNFNELITHTS